MCRPLLKKLLYFFILSVAMTVNCQAQEAKGVEQRFGVLVPHAGRSGSADFAWHNFPVTRLYQDWGILKSRPAFSTPATGEQFQSDVGLNLKLGTDSAAVAVSIAGQSFDTADVMTRRLYTNAILKGYSIESDKESSGKVVTAWTIVLTAETDDTIIAEWTEVRNFLSSRGAQTPIKSYSAVGVLQRVPPT